MNPHDDRPASVDAYEVVEAYWPYDGPYGPEQTVVAAVMVERLVRYLNNATQKRTALPYPATAGSVLASLHAAVFGLQQLVGQLARFAEVQAGDPSLYDDRGDRPGSETALALVVELEDIGPAVVELAQRLGRAAGLADHLGNRE
ncbi:hypothetical protein [Pseudonocardia sp.]|uniref:hypothetical protein n=1 Tax=Pseudonocardia sp. TaxID=60912 RepID=UPI002620C54C|nr:hypothetical protein [Pseudonocardia sp.]